MKQKFISAYMDTAERFSKLSSAIVLRVGAIIVKDNRIISIGYNGMPSGWSNECESKVYGVAEKSLYREQFKEEDGTDYYLTTHDEVIHAEANAVIKLAKDGESGAGTTMFITHAPCIHCAKLIYGAGINTVWYKNNYRDTLGIAFLEKCGVKVNQKQG